MSMNTLVAIDIWEAAWNTYTNSNLTPNEKSPMRTIGHAVPSNDVNINAT
jgi:hypothetical protein